MNRIMACSWIAVSLLLPFTAFAQHAGVSSAGNTINTVAGGGNPAGPALSVDMGDPVAVVKDSAGNVYIAASNLAYVFKLDTSGNVTAVAGQGWGGFGGVGGPASGAVLGGPNGLALDSAHDLFIADRSNHVWMISGATGKLINVAGSSTFQNPTGGYSGDGGPATQAQLNDPGGVAIGNNRNLFVSDTDNYVVRVIQQEIINTYAGNGVACSNPTANPACGDGGPATGANLNLPQGLATDGFGNLYIADTRDNRIRLVNAKGIITTVAGNGNYCVLQNCGDGLPATEANLGNPTGVFVDPSGNLYIADDYDNRIRFVSAATGIISTFAGTGNFAFSGDGGAATLAALSNPEGVFLDSKGNLLIADGGNKRIREVSGGNIETIAGGGSGGDNEAATAAILSIPTDVALDANGNQFIVDTGNSRIRRVDAETQEITTVAGNGDAGYLGDGGPATLASLNVPEGVAVDANEDLFITDPGDTLVSRVDGASQTISIFAGTLFTACLDPTDPCGDGGPATGATFADVGSAAVDSHGNVFISDIGDNRIRCVIGTIGGCGDSQQQYAVGTILTVAGDGVACSSSPNCGDGGPATLANLSSPIGVAVDSAGDLFIADEGDNLIRRVDALTQIITTVAFNGQFSFGGDGGPALDASMESPGEVAVDPNGNLFIGGGEDEVVQRVDFATKTIATVAGNASDPIPYGFKGDGGPATKATLSNFGLSVDGNGNLYIADEGNNRIRAVHMVPIPQLSSKSHNFGDQIIYTSSPPVDIPLSNTGLNDLQIESIGSSGDFSQTNNCGLILAPSLSCDIFVTFTPTRLGIRQGTVTILDNGLTGTQKISLVGNGVGK
jgi:sugar lactone lactonase YvrE